MAQHLAFRRAIGWEMNTWITAHKNNGDRNISLLRKPERRNRINGKQIVTESCKVSVSIPSTNKKARHLTGAGLPSQREGEGRAGPLLARTPPVGQRRPGLPRAGPAVQSALGGLTSGFGMGPGVPPLPWPLAVWGRSASGAVPPCPGGRTARASVESPGTAHGKGMRRSSAD